MIIDCISDLHGHYPKLEGGDLLIVAGDLTARDNPLEHHQVIEWICDQKYRKKVFIAGNHDNYWVVRSLYWKDEFNTEYLCDSGTEFEYEEYEDATHSLEGIVNYRKTFKIWGSPWTRTFEGMNPKCKAFTVDTEEELAEKWALIPDDTDILITHSPAYGLHDGPDAETRYGSTSLLKWIANHVSTLQLHVCGHIHEGYGLLDIRKLQQELGDPRIPVYVNASHVNERYEPVNKPIRIEL